MTAAKSKTSLILACSLALVALPCAFAGHNAENSAAMFKSMDTNGDGKVSRAEHAVSAKKMFADADTNRNGIVTLVEMKSACAKMKADKPAKDEMAAEEMIKMHDQNGDGQLSASEQEAGCESMFTKADTDGDGFLSASECTASHASMKDKKSS